LTLVGAVRWLGAHEPIARGLQSGVDSLSTTKEDADMVVSGYTDEETFYADADDTLVILRSTTGIKPDDVFLEIGCGVGRVGRVLAPLVREWIGCDVSPNMITLAGRRLIGLPNVRLQEISGYDLQPIPDASVDVVYTTVVFMHLEELGPLYLRARGHAGAETGRAFSLRQCRHRFRGRLGHVRSEPQDRSEGSAVAYFQMLFGAGDQDIFAACGVCRCKGRDAADVGLRLWRETVGWRATRCTGFISFRISP